MEAAVIRANGRQVKVVPAGSIGGYSVKLKRGDGSGGYDDVGEVTIWEQRYNLRRVIVSRGWRARYWPFGRGGALVKVGYDVNGCTAETRRDAVKALLRHRGYDVTET
jgi:hypothetical protein